MGPPRPALAPDDQRHNLRDMHMRYNRPVFLAETRIEGEGGRLAKHRDRRGTRSHSRRCFGRRHPRLSRAVPPWLEKRPHVSERLVGDAAPSRPQACARASRCRAMPPAGTERRSVRVPTAAPIPKFVSLNARSLGNRVQPERHGPGTVGFRPQAMRGEGAAKRVRPVVPFWVGVHAPIDREQQFALAASLVCFLRPAPFQTDIDTPTAPSHPKLDELFRLPADPIDIRQTDGDCANDRLPRWPRPCGCSRAGAYPRQH